jgi:hypothetical protein
MKQEAKTAFGKNGASGMNKTCGAPPSLRTCAILLNGWMGKCYEN